MSQKLQGPHVFSTGNNIILILSLIVCFFPSQQHYKATRKGSKLEKKLKQHRSNLLTTVGCKLESAKNVSSYIHSSDKK
jgi:hypothetical protein